MTDAELSALESAARAATPGPWEESPNPFFIHDGHFTVAEVMSHNPGDDSAYIAAANPAAVLELIAMVRSLQNERDYLAEHRPVRYCPTLQKWETCDLPNFDGPYLPLKCFQCWKESAREAVCKNQSES